MYRQLIKDAKRRGLIWELTQEEWEQLVSEPCWYCGDTMSIGLDRLDNKKGYLIDNVLSCCSTCNMFRRAMPIGAFLRICYQIGKRHPEARTF